jgi:hypothetical protein
VYTIYNKLHQKTDNNYNTTLLFAIFQLECKQGYNCLLTLNKNPKVPSPQEKERPDSSDESDDDAFGFTYSNYLSNRSQKKVKPNPVPVLIGEGAE